MLYMNFINKAINETITEADNGLFYLEPLWRNILFENNLNVSDVSDAKVDWNDVCEILQLEVEKRNTINSKKPEVIQWLYDIVSTKIEPTMLEEETEYFKQLMKSNRDVSEKDWEKFKET